MSASRQLPAVVTAFAPATVANVGPGFDCFGFALAGPGDTVRITLSERRGVRLAGMEGDCAGLPADPAKNVATAVAAKMFRAAGVRFGAEVFLRKGLALGSGMGSSSASAVAAAIAANAVLGRIFSDEELIGFARYGEFLACGSAHADNVAPALLGGFIVVRSLEPLDVVRLTVPKNWTAAVVHPCLTLETKRARTVVPAKVSMRDATFRSANAAAVVAAIGRRDFPLFCRAVSGDNLIEPARASLIPGYAAVKAAALRSGAGVCAISGSGPSLFAAVADPRSARRVAAVMVAAWKRRGIEAEAHVSRIGAAGARVIA